MASIRWMGHACFEIKDSLCIVTDPHDGSSIGLPPPSSSADIVLISHGHFDHADGLSLVAKPGAAVIDKPGSYEVLGVKVEGIPSFHDKSGGRERGSNTIFRFEFEGMSFCHLGDLGHLLTGEQLSKVRGVDVLMIPVGGKFTINAKEATQIFEAASPRICIPMHYKVRGLSLPISGVEPFLKGKPRVRNIGGPTVQISKDSLPPEPEVWVLSL